MSYALRFALAVNSGASRSRVASEERRWKSRKRTGLKMDEKVWYHLAATCDAVVVAAETPRISATVMVVLFGIRPVGRVVRTRGSRSLWISIGREFPGMEAMQSWMAAKKLTGM